MRELLAGRGRQVRALLALGLLLGLSPVGTLASWNSAATVQPGSFGTGALDVRLVAATNNVGQALGPVRALDASALVPGESVATSFPVRNDGTTAFRWSVSAVASGTLAPALRWTTTTATSPGSGTTTTSARGVRTGTCAGTAATSNQVLAASATTVVPTQAALPAGQVTYLCVLVSLPAGSGTAGATADATFTVNAVQVAP